MKIKISEIKVGDNRREIDGLKAELAEIDENLVRHNLDYMDEGEQLSRRKEIYEVLYPQTKARNLPGHANNYKQKSSTADSATEKTFSADTSAKTGMSERTIREKIQVAQKLTPEAKEIIKANGISKANILTGEETNICAYSSRYF